MRACIAHFDFDEANKGLIFDCLQSLSEHGGLFLCSAMLVLGWRRSFIDFYGKFISNIYHNFGLEKAHFCKELIEIKYVEQFKIWTLTVSFKNGFSPFQRRKKNFLQTKPAHLKVLFYKRFQKQARQIVCIFFHSLEKNVRRAEEVFECLRRFNNPWLFVMYFQLNYLYKIFRVSCVRSLLTPPLFLASQAVDCTVGVAHDDDDTYKCTL